MAQVRRRQQASNNKSTDGRRGEGDGRKRDGKKESERIERDERERERERGRHKGMAGGGKRGSSLLQPSLPQVSLT